MSEHQRQTTRKLNTPTSAVLGLPVPLSNCPSNPPNRIRCSCGDWIASRYLASILRAPKTVSPPLLRPHPRLPRTLQPVGYRFAHAIPKPTRPAQDASPSSPDATKTRKQLEPHYKLAFTCVPCGDRSSHTVSKQGYHHGSVLITCPSCRNRHIISDHLNIFGDRKITVEDLLREKGQLVKRGTLGEEGDIEFWEDAPADSADAGRA
ncbi:hypothetical protein CHU98_g8318, partial [Xylaria longipes]